MNRIITVWNSANKGKTETLRAFANLLISTYNNQDFIPITPNPCVIPQFGDFRLVVNINGVIIGIESNGDPDTNQTERLTELVQIFNCNLILCTSRNTNNAFDIIVELSNQFNFERIWTSTYETPNSDNHQRLNLLKGQHILELVQTLNILIS